MVKFLRNAIFSNGPIGKLWSILVIWHIALYQQRFFRKSCVLRKRNVCFGSVFSLWNLSPKELGVWRWQPMFRFLFVGTYIPICDLVAHKIGHSWKTVLPKKGNESMCKSNETVQCIFAMWILDNQPVETVATGGREFQTFPNGHWAVCMPLIWISRTLYISAWVASASRTCFPAAVVFSLYLSFLVWVGPNGLPIDKSYPFVIASGRITYTGI